MIHSKLTQDFSMMVSTMTYLINMSVNQLMLIQYLDHTEVGLKRNFLTLEDDKFGAQLYFQQ